MRVFEDGAGTEWMAWEVRPGQIIVGAPERRAGLDRRVAPAPEPVIERRRIADRRVQPASAVTGLATDLAEGWLTFQSGAVRRRLAPIPAGWEDLSDADLAALCGRATPVARPARDRPSDAAGL